MIDQRKIESCRSILIDVAGRGDRIPYGSIAKSLGIANQSIGRYLNAIYEVEITNGRPDLTLVAVYKDTKYGRFNSQGKAPQSKLIDPNNADDVRAYEMELARVYAHNWK